MTAQKPTLHPIVIIGTGLAGYTLARELRRLDKTAPLTMITADDGGFYSKPMLSNAFAQKKQAAQLVTQTAAQMAAQLDAQILTGQRVTTIDPVRKLVTTTERELTYSKLVIAAGAQPIRLTIAGDAADQVLSVNNIDDYALFRDRVDGAASEGPARVAILGAGLIGCEFADDLASAGHLVTLIDPNPVPLSALAAPALSRGLHDALHARGVVMHLGTTASRIDRAGRDLQITLANGTVLQTDIVLSAVGLRSDLRLAQVAGLKTGRGILVNVMGETSASDIFALGDCAEYALDNGETCSLPYIAPLMTAARAIARTLSGEPTAIELKPAPVMVKTPSYPLALVPPPRAAIDSGRWHDEHANGRTVSRFCDAQGVMLGFGLAPQEAGLRQALLAGLGSVVDLTPKDAGNTMAQTVNAKS
jgi:rubredoxin---NAD+ reductase